VADDDTVFDVPEHINTMNSHGYINKLNNAHGLKNLANLTPFIVITTRSQITVSCRLRFYVPVGSHESQSI